MNIREQVIGDLSHKMEVKMEDADYIRDNKYDSLSESERRQACFQDAKGDLIEALSNSRRLNERERDSASTMFGARCEFSSMYYESYYKDFGKSGPSQARKIAEAMTLGKMNETKAA